MARPLRILFPGAWYHVMNRGLEQRKIFLNPADITRFFKLLSEASERFAIEVHAYCLMGNHYHLLMRTQEANLPDAMRHIDGVYTQAFNRTHGRDGPLLRGRYRAVMVQADRHLVGASRYVHLNPVDAGEVHLPEQWPHSSYRAYLGADDQPPWLRTSMILDWFGPVGSRARYRAFVEEGVDQATRSFYTAARLSPVLGSVPYRHEIAAVLGKDLDERTPEIPDARRLRVRPTLRAIARAVSDAFEVEEDEIRAIKRGKSSMASVARGAFIDLAVRVGRYRMRDASSWLGYSRVSSGSNAAARFRAARAESEELNTRVHTAIEVLKNSSNIQNRITKT